MNDLERAKAILPEMTANRRFLHQNPELGMNLKVTTEFVMEKLREMGIEPKLCGGCGVTALIGKKEDGPVFLSAPAAPSPFCHGMPLCFPSPL